MYLYHTHFFFEDQQIEAGKATQANRTPLWLSLDLLFQIGWWLTLHLAVWFAAGAMILAQLLQKYKPTGLQSFCMWAVFATYSILFALDYFNVSLFLGRGGLYVSTYLFLSYLFLGSILPLANRLSTAMIVGGIFLASLIARFEFGAELATRLDAASPWTVGLLLGALIVAVGLMKNRIGLALVALAAAVLVLPITWPFRYEAAIYAARDAVAQIVGNTLPYFAFSDTDPIYKPVIIGLVGSFSPRAWWLACREFPDCLQHFIGPRTIIVPSGKSDSAQVARLASSVVPEATLSRAIRIERPGEDVSIYSLMMPASPRLIPAAKLPSSVGVRGG